MMMVRVITMAVAILACAAAPAPGQTKPAAGGIQEPADYVIGVGDVLGITFWMEETLSGDVIVRPDGKISLALVNEIQAEGLTTQQLRETIETAAAATKILRDPTVGVTLKAINSWRVSICCMVAKPGTYPIIQPTRVFELITAAGGLLEYADKKNIRINRIQKGKEVSFRFNLNDYMNGRNLEQNILLEPGDIITVKD